MSCINRSSVQGLPLVQWGFIPPPARLSEIGSGGQEKPQNREGGSFCPASQNTCSDRRIAFLPNFLNKTLDLNHDLAIRNHFTYSNTISFCCLSLHYLKCFSDHQVGQTMILINHTVSLPLRHWNHGFIVRFNPRVVGKLWLLENMACQIQAQHSSPKKEVGGGGEAQRPQRHSKFPCHGLPINSLMSGENCCEHKQERRAEQVRNQKPKKG